MPALSSTAQGELDLVPERIDYALACLERTQANFARLTEACSMLDNKASRAGFVIGC